MTKEIIRFNDLMGEVRALKKVNRHPDLCRMCRQFIDEDIKRKEAEAMKIIDKHGGVLI